MSITGWRASLNSKFWPLECRRSAFLRVELTLDHHQARERTQVNDHADVVELG